MIKTIQEIIQEALDAIPTITPTEAKKEQDNTNIFYDIDDFNTLEKKLSNLINIDEKKIRKK